VYVSAGVGELWYFIPNLQRVQPERAILECR